jgi:twitching motility protein PilT
VPSRTDRAGSGPIRTRDAAAGRRDPPPRVKHEEPASRPTPRPDPSPTRPRDDPRSDPAPRSDASPIRLRDDPRPDPVARSDSSRIRVDEERAPRPTARIDSGRIRLQPEEAPAAPTPAPVPLVPAPQADLPRHVDPVPAEDRPLGMALVARRSPRPASPRIDAMLRAMIDRGASDLHLSSGCRPMLRRHGRMEPLDGHPMLGGNELSSVLLEIIDETAYEDFVHNADADFAHEVEGVARFRCNYFADRHGIGAVFRQIPMEILTPEKLGLPGPVLDLCWLSKGLVLVTGPTGSGKSTTLAALIDFINRNRDDHIITIEDPIEFVHENKRCLINQREVGRHTRSFKAALRAALREDPDVILVGELRDLETVAIALETAETGHLVFGTLHTTTAPSTVDRIIDQFPGDRQAQIRTMLGESLRGVIGQTLLRRKAGGRVAAYEILLHTSAIGNLIREGKTHQLKNTMQVSKHLGMQNLNDHLLALVKDDVVEAQEAYIKSVDKQNLREMFKKAAIHVELPKED